MNLQEMLSGGGLTLVAVLTLIQIVPIKFEPWTAIARGLGKLLSAEVLEKMAEDRADTARYRILRFDDEIRHEIRHTEEHFNQIMTDIDEYKDYCKEHPKYANGKAVFAIENIERVYRKCKKENSFL